MTLSQSQRQANRWQLAHQDLTTATNYLYALSEFEATPEGSEHQWQAEAEEALLIAAIVVYARQFVNSSSAGFADSLLPIGQMFKGEPVLRSRHKLILELRQQAVAHADWKYHGTELIEFRNEPLRTGWTPDLRGSITPEDFWELIQHVHRQVCRRLLEHDDAAVRSGQVPKAGHTNA